jgi:hypothetical protein
MRLPVFAGIVATPSATLPVAGTVHNTNTLLGYDGFVGVKTGSDDAAGGCFAFRAIRWIDGKRTTITGVVLGQPGHDPVMAGLAAADAMVDRIAGQRATPDLRQRTPPLRTAPGRYRPGLRARQRAGVDALTTRGKRPTLRKGRLGRAAVGRGGSWAASLRPKGVMPGACSSCSFAAPGRFRRGMQADAFTRDT